MALIISAILMIAGCAESDSPEINQGEIRMGLATAPLNLDPRFASDATSERVNRLLYQRLVEFDPQGRPIPGVASWQKLSPLHYRLTLNAKAGRFSPGGPLRTEDVVATYEFVLDPANASPQREAISLIDSVQRVDDRRIDI
ncbi:MAG: ABC transporter substrate-binding protein, partial [Candidatus Thiodiazotropha sp.]